MTDERGPGESDRRLPAAEALTAPSGKDGDDRPRISHAGSVALQWLAMNARRLVEIEDAQRRIYAAVSPLPSEVVSLGPAALGRVLAEEIKASERVPAFDGSAMDGYAVRAEDLATASAAGPVALRVVDESRAGLPASHALASGQAIAISTGAMLPSGTDAVVRIEDTARRGDRIQVSVAPGAGENIRRAGEDIRPGQTLMRSGATLGQMIIDTKTHSPKSIPMLLFQAQGTGNVKDITPLATYNVKAADFKLI